jgi:Neprosin
MSLDPPRSLVRRRLVAGVTALLSAACESSPSGNALDGPDPSGGFTPDAGSAPSLDGGLGADAAAPPSARELELARMQAHLDSLYAQPDVVHRFTTALGDEVDCLPFGKQPGFAQVASLDGAPPVLQAQARVDRPASLAGFGDGVDASGRARSCPATAVPIRRRTLHDLAAFATLEDFLAKTPSRVLDLVDGVGFSHEHGALTTEVPNWGAQTTINVWNPAVEPHDLSISQMWISRGTGGDHQTVEAGYEADPAHNSGDARSRLFIYSTTDNYDVFNKTNCYDLTCKAFVLLAGTRVLIGGRFDKASTLNGEQRELTLRWQFCPANECRAWEGWWLRYEGGATAEWVGFYPRSRYSANGLRDQGGRIDFGGEVAFVRGKVHTTTDMGSGQPPAGGFRSAAYQTNRCNCPADCR